MKGFDINVGTTDTHLFVEAESIEEALDKLEAYYESQGGVTRRDGPVLSIRHKKSNDWHLVYPHAGVLI